MDNHFDKFIREKKSFIDRTGLLTNRVSSYKIIILYLKKIKING